MTDNSHQLVARYVKARKIADTLRPIVESGLITEDALTSGFDTETVRISAAQLAGTHVPSATTWGLVMHLLQEPRRP